MAGPTYTWKIEYQIRTVGIGPDGRAAEGWKVGFVTASGVHSSVFLPLANFNANHVKAAIQEQYAHIEAVHKLEG
jgi:hypothetical protein